MYLMKLKKTLKNVFIIPCQRKQHFYSSPKDDNTMLSKTNDIEINATLNQTQSYEVFMSYLT